MKILILILLLGIFGCSTNYNLKPTSIYTLEDGSKIKVYKTYSETIYIKNNDFSVIKEE